MTDVIGTGTSPDVMHALDIARRLIAAGVPVFAAAPIPGQEGHYALPPKWQLTVPSEKWLNDWRPGWALAAVGGVACDFLDNDPRNGGDLSVAELREAGEFPMVFGHSRTPSGGDHWIVAPTGERKGSPMQGLDLQAGDADGVGRGFVWIAPTVRPSKDPRNAGELVAYRWEVEPDIELLTEAIEDARDSMAGVVSRLRAKRSAPARERITGETVLAWEATAEDPFMTASRASGPALGGVRDFTLDEAQDFVRPALIRLQEAKVGSIEESANTAAATLAHFVPAFWSVDEAYGLLERSAAFTAYDPNGPSDWRLEKFRSVLDGTRPPLDDWKASRKAEPPSPPVVAVETAPGEEALTTLEKLRLKLVTADELANLPAPEPLVTGLLDMDTESWIIGAPGSFKSFVVLDLAAHVGQGKAWQGRPVQRGEVLYLAAEGARGMTLRARAWQERYGTMKGVHFLPYPVKVQSNDGQWAALVELAREVGPALVVIDTQARVTAGLEENSAKDMTLFTDAVSALRRATGACVLVVHHTGRNGGDARGSSAIDGAQDTELKVKRPDNAGGRASLVCELVMDKQKDMAEGASGIQLALDVVGLGEDPSTGRPLSSLVLLPHDAVDAAMRAAGGIAEVNVDVAIWDVIKHPEDWTARVEGVPASATLKRRALQVLADHGHDRGLTGAQVKRIIGDRWTAVSWRWDAVWADVVALELVVNTGGERYAVDQAILAGLRA